MCFFLFITCDGETLDLRSVPGVDARFGFRGSYLVFGGFDAGFARKDHRTFGAGLHEDAVAVGIQLRNISDLYGRTDKIDGHGDIV